MDNSERNLIKAYLEKHCSYDYSTIKFENEGVVTGCKINSDMRLYAGGDRLLLNYALSDTDLKVEYLLNKYGYSVDDKLINPSTGSIDTAENWAVEAGVNYPISEFGSLTNE